MVTLLMTVLTALLPVALIPWVVRSPRVSRTGADLSRAGLLELQNLLQPERKIEILRELDFKHELTLRIPDDASRSL